MGWSPSSHSRRAIREPDIMWLLFIPILALVVVILTVFSLLAGVVWIAGSTWPWLLIGLGAWMFWHEDGRHHRRRRHHASWVSEPRSLRPDSGQQPQARPAPAESKSKSKSSDAKAQPELPIDVQVKV